MYFYFENKLKINRVYESEKLCLENRKVACQTLPLCTVGRMVITNRTYFREYVTLQVKQNAFRTGQMSMIAAV